MMKGRLSDRTIIAGLIVLLIVELGLLVMHLSWGGFRPRANEKEVVVAGVVQKNENELHRRSLNSLVWEKSNAKDSLYYHDSVLTLAQSTATLRLFKETDVNLSENTLVTIEPPEQNRTGEIRLKFYRGGFRARNPLANTQVESESWSMQIKTGSDIDLRQVDDKNFELTVKQGHVDLNNGETTTAVTNEQVLRIEGTNVQKMEMREELKWLQPPPKRIYTHDQNVNVVLKWQGGEPKQIVRQTLSQSEQVVKLDTGENKYSMNLPLGYHRLFLRADDATSEAMDIEVWSAPVLHLLSPLPRNRIKTETETAFMWTWPPGIAKFVLQVQGGRLNMNLDADKNSLTSKFQEEDDVEWSVRAKDKEGFDIPPLYSYPLYIREQPLAAPKLKGPEIRKPAADKGALFLWKMWNIILPQARAEDDVEYQALFSWEPVIGADHYVIEISETSDFRKPLVTEKVLKPEYTWNKVHLKNYFWRVAAGAKKGKLGFFSDPQEADLSKPQVEGVKVKAVAKKVEELPSPVLPVKSAPPLVKSEEPPSPPRKPFFSRKLLEWKPSFSIIKGTAPQTVTVNLKGAHLTSLALQLEKNLGDYILETTLDYANFNFQPEPKNKFPFQKNLSWSEMQLAFMWRKVEGHLGFGAFVWQTTKFGRTDLEAINNSTIIMFGPSIQSVWQWGSVEYIGDYSGAFFGSSTGLSTEQKFRWKFNSWSFGVGGKYSSTTYTGGKTSTVTGGASLGFDF